MPALSVVMSVYNGERFLAEAVESILRQTFSDFEFIIIDDGSTDQTPAILADYARRDARLRVLPQSNRGRAESLNRGIHVAAAPLIARMDADDIALPLRFEKQMDFIASHPRVGLLGAGIDLVTTDGRRIDSFSPPAEDRDLRVAMLRNNPFRHPTMVMRKEVVVSVGGYRKALLDCDDFDLWLRMAEHTEIANLPYTLLLYRLHADQVTTRNMIHQVLCAWVARAAAARRKEGLPDPLSGVEEITPEFASSLGINPGDVYRDAAAGLLYWSRFFAAFSPEGALRVIDNVQGLFDSGTVGRTELAAALMQAAGIHLRGRRFAKALASAGRAAMTEPISTGRIARMALTHRFRAFRERRLNHSVA
jgi:glycosyltransferase involved in cell wall biosynthesis